MIYLALHRIEFTWFHYSRTVHTFCCTGPILTNDGCYPLCCPMVSGLSYPVVKLNQQVTLLDGKFTNYVGAFNYIVNFFLAQRIQDGTACLSSSRKKRCVYEDFRDSE